jgi:hypothetical protein
MSTKRRWEEPLSNGLSVEAAAEILRLPDDLLPWIKRYIADGHAGCADEVILEALRLLQEKVRSSASPQ